MARAREEQAEGRTAPLAVNNDFVERRTETLACCFCATDRSLIRQAQRRLRFRRQLALSRQLAEQERNRRREEEEQRQLKKMQAIMSQRDALLRSSSRSRARGSSIGSSSSAVR